MNRLDQIKEEQTTRIDKAVLYFDYPQGPQADARLVIELAKDLEEVLLRVSSLKETEGLVADIREKWLS